MIPEIGSFTLILSLCLSLALAIIPLVGASTGNVQMMRYARPLASGMFLFLTILAIIISAMGLYGLSSFTAEQRTKEIGIRKVLGASVSQIMKMLTKDFIKLVLIANIFAWPITYLLAKNWLSNFSYQIDMPIMPYVFATILALIIALLTVSTQAYLAANSDPVNALKYE